MLGSILNSSKFKGTVLCSFVSSRLFIIPSKCIYIAKLILRNFGLILFEYTFLQTEVDFPTKMLFEVMFLEPI